MHYNFPPVRWVEINTPNQQIQHINEEVGEVMRSETTAETDAEVMDALHSCETYLRIREKQGLDVDELRRQTLDKNHDRGYYDTEPEQKVNIPCNNCNGNYCHSWNSVKARTFEFEQSDTCPTCNQPLPAEQLTEAREKAQADFNRKKAGDLENINHSGKTLKASIDELVASNKEIEKKLTAEREKLATAEAKAQELKNDIDNLRLVMDAYSENPAYVQLLEQQAEISQAIADLKDGNTASVAPLKAEIGMLENEISSLEMQLAQVEQSKKGHARIEELKGQEKLLTAEYERLEGQTFLCEEFTRVKVKMMDEKINSRFKLARFKLFNVLVNGGVEDCCITLCNGVPYGSGLNTGHEILVGLDIINTLGEHHNFYPMIFIDRAESVTNEIQTSAQQIRLIAKKGEKKLLVEYPVAKETRLFEREAV